MSNKMLRRTSQSLGYSNGRRPDANLPKIEEVGPYTPQSKSTAIPRSTPTLEFSIDMPDDTREDSDAGPSNGGREQQWDATKTNDTHWTPLSPPGSSTRENFFEDDKGNEKSSVNHKNRHIMDPRPPQELGYEITVNMTADEMSTQRTSPGVKAKAVTGENVGLQAGWTMKMIPTNTKPVVDNEESGVDGEDGSDNRDESETEYDGEIEREDDNPISLPVEGSSSHVLSQLEIASSIDANEHHEDSNQQNKSSTGKKGKGKDSEPAWVGKSNNYVKARRASFAMFTTPFWSRTNGSAANPEANPGAILVGVLLSPLHYEPLSSIAVLIGHNMSAPVVTYEVGDSFKWRWHWRETGGGDPQSERKYSVIVPRDKDRKCTLPAGKIPSGFYSIVFCATISCVSDIEESLDSLTVDANLFDSSDELIPMNKTCKTTAEKEELNQIKLGRKTRVRLHRQIELPKDGQCQYIEFTIKVKACDSLKFNLLYVELQRCNITDSEDIVLFGQGKPQEYISVGHHTKGPVVGVHSYNISSSGTYATTLCFPKDNRAVIEIWSLKHRDNKDNIKGANDAAPRHHTTPLARGYIKTAENLPNRAHICLSVSSHGDYVALHSNTPLEKRIDCQVLRNTKDAADGSDSELRKLSEISLPQGLQEFSGYGTFHFLSEENENEQARELERYITCDGKSLSIYSTTGDWTRTQTIDLSDIEKLASARNTILSMRGKYFTWTGKKNHVSIIHVDDEKKINLKITGAKVKTRTCLSRDGSQVAVLARGWIDIYETSSGNRVVRFGDGKYDNSRFEAVLENGFVMMLDPPGEGEPKVTRKVVRTDGKAWNREHNIHPEYELRYPALMGEQLFAYSQGTVVNITRMDSKMIGAPEPRIFKEDIKMDKVSMLKIAQSPKHTSLSNSGNTFNLFTKKSVIHGKSTTILTIEFCHSDPYTSATPANAASATSESPIGLTMPLGTSHTAYPALFLEGSSRLVIITGRYLQVWKLSSPTTSDDSIAELELVWALQQEDKKAYKLSDICYRQVKDAHADLANGAQFMVTLKPAKWREGSDGLLNYTEPGNDKVVTVPFSNKDNMLVSLEGRVQQGIRGVVDMYINGDPECQKAVIRYLESLVLPSKVNHVSCIAALCNLWRFDEKEFFEKIMAELLPKTRTTWIPEINARNKNAGQDPLAILLETAKAEPSAIGVAKVIMDYCVSHANSTRNLKFLAPVFISMRELRKMFPDEAQGCLNRMAFIHAVSRQYIIHNHIVVHSPIQKLQFWKPVRKLWETKNPIMQLCETRSDPNPENELFTLPVFVASFDALWSYNLDDDRSENSEASTEAREMERTTTKGESMLNMSRWWEVLYKIKFKLRLKGKIYVECYDYNLEIFDNPAIAALVTYKWDTIGFRYWLFRFIFQCCYYAMIVFAAILQVYFPYRPVLVGVFIAIIVMAVAYLWLELLEAAQSPSKYVK
ncbi:hypothetical protein BGZ58_002075 [Dissophora ornata]|nr:hypothetical protein BGZ58_002075 [Dissophora ornata]